MINLRITEPEVQEHEDFDLLHRHFSTAKNWEEVKKEYPFGVGQVSLRVKDSKDFEKGSVWFVKPKVEGVREVFDKMNFSKASGLMNSLSKALIVEEYIKNKHK